MTVPDARPPVNRRQTLIARVAGVAGLLLLAVTLAALIAAMSGGTTLQRDARYVWRSGSELFIANNSDLQAAACTLQGSAENRWVTVAKRPNSFFENFHTNGGWARRFQSGPITVTCDHEVSLSSGPLTRLYPIAATPWPLLGGLLLIAFWRVRRGGRFTRLFFRSRSRA